MGGFWLSARSALVKLGAPNVGTFEDRADAPKSGIKIAIATL